MAFTTEEVEAGKALYEEEYFHLKPTFGVFVQSWIAGTMYGEETEDSAKAQMRISWPYYQKKREFENIAYEFLTNVARYYDILIKCHKAAEKPGERYLMNELAANIDRIKRLCNQSVDNGLINPLNFTYEKVVVENGQIRDEEMVYPFIRSKHIPALLGSSGTTEEALTAYEYGIALGFATGLTYEWIYSLVDDSLMEKNIKPIYQRRTKEVDLNLSRNKTVEVSAGSDKKSTKEKKKKKQTVRDGKKTKGLPESAKYTEKIWKNWNI